MAQGSNVKILVTLADRDGCVRSQEFVAEDLCQEYIVGLVLRFEAVAADGGVGASQVSWFPGFVQGAEGCRNVLGELRACGGVDGIGTREAFEIPELSERPDNFLWLGQNGDGVRLKAGAGNVAGFSGSAKSDLYPGLASPTHHRVCGPRRDRNSSRAGEL
jgi:hypothetical protein